MNTLFFRDNNIKGSIHPNYDGSFSMKIENITKHTTYEDTCVTIGKEKIDFDTKKMYDIIHKCVAKNNDGNNSYSTEESEENMSIIFSYEHDECDEKNSWTYLCEFVRKITKQKKKQKVHNININIKRKRSDEENTEMKNNKMYYYVTNLRKKIHHDRKIYPNGDDKFVY